MNWHSLYLSTSIHSITLMFTAEMQLSVLRGPALLLLAISVLSACDEDTLGPDEATSTFAAQTAIQVNGTVGTAVTATPAVKATDASGQPVSGLNVTFAVTGGGTIGR